MKEPGFPGGQRDTVNQLSRSGVLSAALRPEEDVPDEQACSPTES